MRLDEIYTLCLRHGFTPDAAATMAAIALAESGGNPAAECVNCVPGVKETSIGLYQINMDAWPQYGRPCLHDPDCSTIAAYTISLNGSNFTPWTEYKNGGYKKYYVPPGNIVSAGGQAIDPNVIQKAANAAGNAKNGIIDKLGGALGTSGITSDTLKQTLIALVVLGSSLALIFLGVYGMIMAPARDVVSAAAKAGAL